MPAVARQPDKHIHQIATVRRVRQLLLRVLRQKPESRDPRSFDIFQARYETLPGIHAKGVHLQKSLPPRRRLPRRTQSPNRRRNPRIPLRILDRNHRHQILARPPLEMHNDMRRSIQLRPIVRRRDPCRHPLHPMRRIIRRVPQRNSALANLTPRRKSNADSQQ